MTTEWVLPAAAALGFSRERLRSLAAQYRRDVASGLLPGVNLLISKSGQPVYKLATGYRDIESRTPLQFDDLFRLYSMTKPVAAVLSLRQIEAGLYQMDTEVTKFLPELSELNAHHEGSLAAASGMTVWHLLTHTSGFTAEWNTDAAAKLYRENFVVESQPHNYASQPLDLKDFVRRISGIPLKHLPGKARTYGVSNDVQGLLIERAANKPLETVVG